MTTVGIVLAAGASRRFGPENKLLAHFRGGPLVAQAAQAMAELHRAQQVAHYVAVVAEAQVGAVFTAVDTGCDIVSLDAPDVQSTSLGAGLARARVLGADRILITLGDMPLITSNDLRGLLATAAPITATTDGSTIMPPACFDRAYFDDIAKVQGDRGAGKLLKTLPDEALFSVPTARLSDVDTARDLSDLQPE